MTTTTMISISVKPLRRDFMSLNLTGNGHEYRRFWRAGRFLRPFDEMRFPRGLF
jgi:hypothetical protein